MTEWIKSETEQSMKPLIEPIKKGLPPTKDAYDGEIHEFWNCLEELSVIEVSSSRDVRL